MSKIKAPLLILAALSLAAPALAAPNGHNNGTGWGVGKVPPGHQKKMQRQTLSNYIIIDDPRQYGLPILPADQMYVRSGDEVYQVMRDTATVVEAIGIISDLLN